MLVINKEERADKIYITYEGNCFEFPEYDSALGVRVLLHYNETKDKYRATYSQFKKENFISKIRALTEQSKQLSFREKYPIHALEIEQAAKQGNNYYFIPCGCLARFEKEDLEKEGFKVEQYNALEYKISW